jgi:hypothetical protein
VRSTFGIETGRRRRFRVGAPPSRLLAILGILVGAAAPASAEPSAADAVLAETLFREGKELMGAKRFDVACPKLAESYRLDPGTGTLLALGLCHEGEGRIASAWVELTDVLGASGEARPDRVALARERLARIEPVLSKLTVAVPPSIADTPSLEIFRDDVRLDRPAWGTAVPIDGGAHSLAARATNRKPWVIHFEMAAHDDRRTIEVPALLPESSPSVAGVAAEAAPSDTPVVPSAPDSSRQSWEITLGAVGVASLGTGAYFGVTAISEIHDAKTQCPSPPSCTNPAALVTNSDGKRDALIADFALGAGVVAGGAAIVLLLTGHSSRGVAISIVPWVSPSNSGVTIGRAF